jgi:hypothetical protein
VGFKSSFQLLTTVLLLSGIALGTSDQSDGIVIKVFVNNTAKVSGALLDESEAEVGRIFHAASIRIAWVHCQDKHFGEDICSRVPAVNEFVVHLIPTGSTSSDSVFGMAFVGLNGIGRYCNIFVDRIKQAEDNVASTAELMGTVMAHELGHLLLGSRSHSAEGLMRPIWDHQCLRGIGMGRFLFTPQQSLLIRERYRKAAIEIQSNRLSEGN